MATVQERVRIDKEKFQAELLFISMGRILLWAISRLNKIIISNNLHSFKHGVYLSKCILNTYLWKKGLYGLITLCPYQLSWCFPIV